jgi:hypothetical protein
MAAVPARREVLFLRGKKGATVTDARSQLKACGCATGGCAAITNIPAFHPHHLYQAKKGEASCCNLEAIKLSGSMVFEEPGQTNSQSQITSARTKNEIHARNKRPSKKLMEIGAVTQQKRGRIIHHPPNTLTHQRAKQTTTTTTTTLTATTAAKQRHSKETAASRAKRRRQAATAQASNGAAERDMKATSNTKARGQRTTATTNHRYDPQRGRMAPGFRACSPDGAEACAHLGNGQK